MLPKTPFADVYRTQNEDELKYLRLFAKQLKLNKESGCEHFCFAAVTILINNHLSPHVDAMNLRENNNYTMAFSMNILLKEISSNIQNVLEWQYPNGVPLCIVIYCQRCLEILSIRRICWNKFVGKNENEKRGRQLLLNIIKMANMYDNYIGFFWSPKNRSKLFKDFIPQPLPGSSFKTIISAAVFPNAVDKMVRISHVFEGTF